MGLHLTGGQALGRQRDDQLVDTGEPPLPLGHDLRLERPVTVAGDLDLDRPDLGQHRLGPAPVAGVPAITARGVVAVVAEVVGELAFQGGLDQPLGQLGEQPALTGQLQPTLAGLAGQPSDQLLVHRVQAIGRQHDVVPIDPVKIHCLLTNEISHRVHTP